MLEQKNDAAWFFGFHIEHDPKIGYLIWHNNSWLSKYWKLFGLDVVTANEKLTPTKGKPLAKHVHGKPASGDFIYSSVVGMLLYFVTNISQHYSCYQLCHKMYVLPKACTQWYPHANWWNLLLNTTIIISLVNADNMIFLLFQSFMLQCILHKKTFIS